MYEIRRCRRDEIMPLVRRLEFAECHAPQDAIWWKVEERTRSGSHLAAFAGLQPHKHPHCGFLCLSGVVPEDRGNCLQRRLIRVRERYAKCNGIPRVVSYTAPDNVHSANNLIACGYRLYVPPYHWGLRNGIYFQKEL